MSAINENGKIYAGALTMEALMKIIKGELATKLSEDDLDSLQIITDLQSKLTEIAGEDGTVKNAEHANAADTATNATQLDGKAASEYVTNESLAQQLEDYLKEENLISSIDELDDLEDDAKATAAAALVKELYDKVMNFENNLTSAWETEVSTVVEKVLGEKAGNDLATLDESGKVPSSQLPSYVDDVIEGYLVSETDDDPEAPYHFYVPVDEEEDAEFDPEDPTKDEKFEEYKPERSKIYVDLKTNLSYRWSGSTFVEVSSNDMVEITPDRVVELWNAIEVPEGTSL